MNKPALLTLTLLTSAALALPLAAQAKQPDAAATSKHAAKKPAHKTKKGVPFKKAKAVEANTPAQTLSERLTDAELQIAQEIYTGTFPCELGEHVTVAADTAHQGFFAVTAGKRRYYMHPVESRTGAIRMEDNRHGAVWLQLGSKSMLMDQQTGQRVADDCQAAAQHDYAAHKKDHPQPELLDRSAGGGQQPSGVVISPVSGGGDSGQPPESAASQAQPAGQTASTPASVAEPANRAAGNASAPAGQAASAP